MQTDRGSNSGGDTLPFWLKSPRFCIHLPDHQGNFIVFTNDIYLLKCISNPLSVTRINDPSIVVFVQIVRLCWFINKFENQEIN